jgi:Mg2+ and Co2+ transporter CorA
VRSRHVTTTGVVEVPTATTADTMCTEDGLVWVDLDHTDERGMALLPQLLDARPIDVEDCHARTPVPKLHLYPDHHYTAINGLSRGSNGRLYFQPLKVFQNPHLVITVLGPTSSALPRDAARRELDAVHHRLDGGHFRPTNSLELITAIRREMMGTLEHLIGDAAARIATFEKQVLEADPVKSEKLLQQLFELRHDLQTIPHQRRPSPPVLQQPPRDSIPAGRAPHRRRAPRERTTAGVRTHHEHHRPGAGIPARDAGPVSDAGVHRTQPLRPQGDRLGLSRARLDGDRRTVRNELHAHMPELSWTWGYPAVLAVMAMVGIILVIFFRRHGWL